MSFKNRFRSKKDWPGFIWPSLFQGWLRRLMSGIGLSRLSLPKSNNQSLVRLLVKQVQSKSAIIVRVFVDQVLLLTKQTKTEINREYRSYKVDYQDQTQIKNNLGIIVFAFSSIFVGLTIIGSMIGYLIVGDLIIAAGLIMISIPVFLIGSVFAYLVNRASR